MKKITLFIAITIMGTSIFSQHIVEDICYNSKRYKYKNEKRYLKGKPSNRWEKFSTKVVITDGGKTLYIDGKRLHKAHLDYSSKHGEIVAYNNRNYSSGNIEDNLIFFYTISGSDLYQYIREKVSEEIYLVKYKVEYNSELFDVIRKYATN